METTNDPINNVFKPFMESFAWDDTTGRVDAASTDNNTVIDGLTGSIYFTNYGIINDSVDMDGLIHYANQLSAVGLKYTADDTAGVTQQDLLLARLAEVDIVEADRRI